MAQKMTTIRLTARPRGAGFMDYGLVPALELIARYREIAKEQKQEAEAVLAAKDEDFRIEYVDGIHVGRLIRVIQEGR